MNKRKATFSLPEEMLQAMDAAVAEGAARNKNVFVQNALTKELYEWQREERRRLWAEAMRDPLFLKDVRDVEEDFAWADSETISDEKQ